MTAALLLGALLVLALGELRAIVREDMRNGPKAIHYHVDNTPDGKLRRAADGILRARGLLLGARNLLAQADMTGLAKQVSEHEEKLGELVMLIDAASFPETSSDDRETLPAPTKAVR